MCTCVAHRELNYSDLLAVAGALTALTAQDEFALQTLRSSSHGKTGFVTANVVRSSACIDMLDSSAAWDQDAARPDRPLLCRLELCVAEQYAAAKALAKFDEQLAGDEEERQELSVAAEEEAEANEMDNELSCGQQAVFGGAYQLKSSAAEKYIQVLKSIAEDDATALRVQLAESAARTKGLWFRMQPGFRFRNESEPVRMGDTVVLQSMLMPTMFLHTDVDKDGQVEVDCKDVPTRYRVVPVAKGADIAAKAVGKVRGGDFVSIFQRQTESYVHRDMDGRAVCILLDGEPDNEDAPPTVRIDMMWQINMPKMRWSGVLASSEANLVSLRDAISGQFLTERQDGSLTFEDTDTDQGSMWTMVAFEDTGEGYDAEMTNFYLQNLRSGRKLSRGARTENASDPHQDSYDMEMTEVVHEDNLFVFRAADDRLVRRFMTNMTKIGALRRFNEATEDCAAQLMSGQSSLPAIQKQYLLPNPEIESESIYTGPLMMICESLITELVISSNPDPITRSGLINLPLQNFLVEMRLVNFFIDNFIPGIFSVVSAEEVSENVEGPYLKRLVQYVFVILSHLARENEPVSEHLFERLDFISKYNEGYGFRVTNLIAEIFVDNAKLMRLCDDELISSTWQLCIKTRAPRFFGFIHVMLSVNGAPLKYNQDRLSEVVSKACPSDLFTIDFQTDSDELINFHNALIKMVSLLCAGRHRFSIDFFLSEVGLSYKQVLAIIVDETVKHETRSAYTQLMKALFVDREPYEIHEPVQPSRIMPPLSGSTADVEARVGVGPPKSVDPYANFPPSVERPTAGFADLKQALEDLLGTIQYVKVREVAKNDFHANLVALANELLLFAIYDGASQPGTHHDGVIMLGPETSALAKVLLPIFDIDADDMDGCNPDDKFLANDVETSTVIRMRTNAIKLLRDLVGLRSSKRIHTIMEHLAAAGATFEQENLGERAAEAMDAAQSVKIYDTEATNDLQTSLLAMLQYNDQGGDLCLAALQALVMFVSQRYTFAKNLKKISILGTNEAASAFLRCGEEVSEFRRLRKWLHLDKECQQTIDVAQSLCGWCETESGQDILRNLNIEEYVIRVLRMRLNSNIFPDVMRATMQLVGHFCRGNKTNQLLFARHMDGILLILLRDPLYYIDAAKMIEEVVFDNEILSVRFSGLLVGLISDLTLSPEHGRQHVLLELVDTLLIVEGHPVSISQVQICKGAMVSTSLIETEGDLTEEDWGGGQALDRAACLAVSLGDSHQEQTRCEQAMAYYCKSMQVLGTCARGKMPTTELLCAAKLPFDEMVLRIQEIMGASQGKSMHPTAVAVKTCLLSFFREVFVDTNSKQILRMLRKPYSGLWSIDAHSVYKSSIAQSLLEDMSPLAASTGTMNPDYRLYLFEQVLVFFLQYTSAVDPSSIIEEEMKAVADILKRVGYIVDEAIDGSMDWNEREMWLLSSLQGIIPNYLGGVPGSFNIEKGTKSQNHFQSEDENTLAWKAFLNAAISQDDVRNVRGTERLVGRGIMDLAMALCDYPNGVDNLVDSDSNFASFLVGPVRAIVANVKDIAPTDMNIVPTLQIIFDIIRAIPYAGTVHTEMQKKDSFYRFADAVELNCSTNPDLAAIQARLVRQGWATLCFEVLATNGLKEVHLTVLQLLMALSGGGNVAVQDTILENLQDVDQNPNEIFAAPFRRLLELCAGDLKSARKAAQDDHDGDFVALGFAFESLTVLLHLCMGHEGMKDYIREQTGRLEHHDLVADVVEFMGQLERDLKILVNKEAEEEQEQHDTGIVVIDGQVAPESLLKGTMFDNPVAGATKGGSNRLPNIPNIGVKLPGFGGEEDKDDSEVDPRFRPLLDQATAAFQLLKHLASGPHKMNQKLIANSDIMSVINRLLSYTEYELVEDVDEGGPVLGTVKGLLNSQISFCLLALVEGLPDESVVTRILNGLDWENIHRHLKVLKSIISDGVMPLKLKKLHGHAEEQTKKKKKKKKKKKTGPEGESVPSYVVNTKTGEVAEWLRREAFRFYSFAAKIRFGGQKLNAKDGGDALKPMRALLFDAELLDFYDSNVGQAEVIRDGNLENLFFWMPDNFRSPKDNKMIEARLQSTLDTAPREDTGGKLSHYLEGAYEVVADMESINKSRNFSGAKIPAFYAWSARVIPTMYLSFFISIVCCASMDRNSSLRSFDRATFGRWPPGFDIFMGLAILHFIISVVRTYAFLQIRAPVLKEMYNRASKLEFRSKQGDDSIDHEPFAERTIVVYGLPYKVKGKIISESFVRQIFEKNGAVCVVRVVPVEPQKSETGEWTSANNSWALVSFTRKGSVKSLIEKQSKHGGVLEKGGVLKGQPLHIIDIQMDHVEGNAALEAIAEDAEVDLYGQLDDEAGTVVKDVASIINKFPLGTYFPLTAMYVFKTDAEVRECFLDIIFAVCGIYWSPLFFTFHLFKLLKTPGALIVVTSLTHNVGRLSVTLLLCLLFTWVSAVSGWLFFMRYHVEDSVDNDGGPCANLLTCFFSYSYAGLMQSGVGGYITGLKFPVTGVDLLHPDFWKILWEILFSFLSAVVVSVITGIICDTFGELRGDQDEAEAFQGSTNFITGIDFAEIPEEKSTHYLQYVYLLLYLRQRREKDLTPLERVVRDHVRKGEIEWMPDGRCISAETGEDEDQEMQEKLDRMKQQLREDMEDELEQFKAKLTAARGSDV